MTIFITSDSGIDWPAWVQAVGSIVAILAAIGLVAYQEYRRDHEARKKGREMAQAAASLAFTAIERVADRFAAAAHEPDKPMRYSLRGFRTTEAVEALRGLDVAALPPSLVEAFSQVRADAYAVNARISEVFQDDARRKAERLARLESAGRVFVDALDALGRLRKAAKRYEAELRYVPLEAGFEHFLETCKRSDARND